MSGTSTMRNAVKRITHKERAQPADRRKKFGLLEKHKDYIERAQDYKKKQKTITSLRRKAETRNPDEFYFKMNSSQVRHGIHRDGKSAASNSLNGNAMDPAMINLLKTQDMGYIVMKKAVDDSKIKQLKQSLHKIGRKRVKSHKVFVPSSKQLETFDVAEHFDTTPDMIKRAFNRPKLLRPSRDCDFDSDSSGEEDSVEHDDDGAGGVISRKRTLAAATAVKSSRTGDSSEQLFDPQSIALDNNSSLRNSKTGKAKKPHGYKELRERVKRSKHLKVAMEQLALQRQLTTSKGTRRKIVLREGGADTEFEAEKAIAEGKPPKPSVVYKWKRQRQR